jgi:hypothetical protein
MVTGKFSIISANIAFEKFCPILDADIDLNDREGQKMYATCLFILILSYLKGLATNIKNTTGTVPFIPMGLVRGNIYYPEQRLLVLDYEWLEVQEELIDLILGKMCNPSLTSLNLPLFPAIILTNKIGSLTHNKVEVYTEERIYSRMETPIKLKDGTSPQMKVYLKKFGGIYV